MTSKLAYDMPDDWPWLPGSARFPLADMGELAVRLGSPFTYDRRGEVLWMDVCDKGTSPFFADISSAGASFKTSVKYPLHGGYCLKLTSGSDEDHSMYIARIMSYVSMLRCGLEVALFLDMDIEYFKIQILRYTGTQLFTATLRLNYITHTLQCYAGDLIWHYVGPLPAFIAFYGIDHHIKLVADFETGYHVRALLNENVYDLSSHALLTSVSNQAPLYEIIMELTGRNTFNDFAYLQHVIVTGNEP